MHLVCKAYSYGLIALRQILYLVTHMQLVGMLQDVVDVTKTLTLNYVPVVVVVARYDCSQI